MASYYDVVCDTSNTLGFSEILVTTFLYGIAYGERLNLQLRALDVSVDHLNAFVTAFHLAVSGYTLASILQRRKNAPHHRKHATFIVALVVLGTVNIVAYLAPLPRCERRAVEWDRRAQRLEGVARFIQRDDLETWSVHVADPSAVIPRLYHEQLTSIPFLTGGEKRVQHIAAWLLSILVQGYLLYRCHLLLARKFVTGFLGLLLSVTIGFGLLNIIMPRGDFVLSGYQQSDSARAYWALTLAFNLLANLLIITRLLWLRAKVAFALGREFGTVYTGIAAILMESSLLFSIVLVLAYLFLPGPGGTNSVFSPLVTQVEAIASELIILRFALGRAMSKKDVATVTAHRSKVDFSRTNTIGSTTSTQDTKTVDVVETGPRRVLPVWFRPRITREASLETSTFSQFPSSVAAVLRSQAESTNPSTTVDRYT